MADTIIENPTYMEHIRYFFEEKDLDHMKQKGIDLSTHSNLVQHSASVFFQTQPPDASMPPDASRKWSEERSQTFKNWIKNGCPRGEPKPKPPKQDDVARVRKGVHELPPDGEEVALLKRAFEGLMNKPADDPDSYQALAGIHWYPTPIHCKHHEDRYNPWHRAYLRRFEDALRSIPECSEVTLPWWDITRRPPDWLFSEPFASFKLKEAVHPDYDAGIETSRFTADEIVQNVATEDISGNIADALKESSWEGFVTYTGRGIEAAHDAGHGACGTTLATPDIAAFDPLFWFFHANWDRLWWRWQQVMDATTIWKLRSTIMGSTDFLEAPFNTLPPFGSTVDEVIDLAASDTTYSVPTTPTSPSPTVSATTFGSLRAAKGLRIAPSPRASVRVKGIDRLQIPGSFRVLLFADAQQVGRRTFFQGTHPRECANCRKRGTINLDFIVDSDLIQGRKLDVVIEVLIPKPGLGARFPLQACGNPTVNVRMLLQAP